MDLSHYLYCSLFAVHHKFTINISGYLLDHSKKIITSFLNHFFVESNYLRQNALLRYKPNQLHNSDKAM